ncbi:MAG: TnsA endonuclease N-terminal domain-containing protein [Clostridium sp.]|uniref:TnsA endonuclease N-terminal domain-containing protein n=1 Tax=Clostridium sp. TaxID=1506 RepID=UPI003F3E11DA
MRRKTDKAKRKEKRGTGYFEEYSPWIQVHEFGSKGRTHRILGWKIRRVYQFMSDLELYYFVLRQWEDEVIDIREQYPLLSIECTKLIAEEFGVTHPPKNSKEKVVMTTDFIITLNQNGKSKNIARAIKSSSDIKSKRTLEKLQIEKEFWEKRNIEWGIVTEKNMPMTKAKNIYQIYMDYFWYEESDYEIEKKKRVITELLLKVLKKNNVLEATGSLEKEQNLQCGEGIRILNFLILKKIIKVNMNIKLNYDGIKIFKGENYHDINEH